MSMVENFIKHGDKASYHYADDSAGEWGLGNNERDLALEIFDNASDPERVLMRQAAQKFLWAYDFNKLRPAVN